MSVIPALSEEERARIESGLTGKRVLGSIYVDDKAKITVEVLLTPSATEDRVFLVEQAVSAAMTRIAEEASS